MNKAQIKQAALDYIARQDSTSKEEWYDTTQEFAQCILEDFLHDLRIDISEKEKS